MTNTATKQQEASPAIDEFSFSAIRARLAAPIDAKYISIKNLGGRDIPFVNITDMKDILDERVPVWESHVAEVKQIGENLCVVVRLSIHTTDGVFSQDGTGLEMLNVNSYGDPFSNAYAQAFRRACEGFALGRDLWRKPHPTAGNIQTAGTPLSGPAGRRPQVKPTQGKADNAHEPATPAQLVLLNRKISEAGIDPTALLQTEFADVAAVGELSKRAASYLIDLLIA